eukprot:4673110-Pleurochrysis_carterae.AAC.6
MKTHQAAVASFRSLHLAAIAPRTTQAYPTAAQALTALGADLLLSIVVGIIIRTRVDKKFLSQLAHLVTATASCLKKTGAIRARLEAPHACRPPPEAWLSNASEDGLFQDRSPWLSNP